MHEVLLSVLLLLLLLKKNTHDYILCVLHDGQYCTTDATVFLVTKDHEEHPLDDQTLYYLLFKTQNWFQFHSFE